MSIVNIAKTMKEVHPHDVLLFKRGTFFHAYGKDAQLLSYYFNYQIKTVEKNIPTCGFPQTACNKVRVKFESEKINYKMLDVKNNYDVIEEHDNGNLEKYAENYEKARKVVNLKTRLNNLTRYLLDEIDSESIGKKIIEIERIAYET